MKIGYARISTIDQNLDLQLDALKNAGCEQIFEEVGSGSSLSRSELHKAMSYMRQGDTLVVWRLDRLGRNQLDLLKLLNMFDEKGIGFLSLTEGIDTSSITGRFFFQMLGALAEMERNIILDRTKAGREAAKRRGVHMGRPRIVTNDKLNQAKLLYEKGLSHKEIMKILGIAQATYYRNMRPLLKNIDE